MDYLMTIPFYLGDFLATLLPYFRQGVPMWVLAPQRVMREERMGR